MPDFLLPKLPLNWSRLVCNTGMEEQYIKPCIFVSITDSEVMSVQDL